MQIVIKYDALLRFPKNCDWIFRIFKRFLSTVLAKHLWFHIVFSLSFL